MNLKRLLLPLAALVLPAASPLHAAEYRLEPLKTAYPALSGYLGDPGLGFISNQKPYSRVWLENGLIYAFSSRDYAGSVCRWQLDASTRQARLKDVLNVGGAWSITRRGEFLCAQFSTQTKADQMTEKPDHLGLFRTDDGSCLWQVPVEAEEYFLHCTFTTDEKQIALLSLRAQQMSLRLIDVQNGQMVRRHDFEGVEGQSTGGRQLIARAGVVWMRRGDGRILRIPLETLEPQKIQCPAGDGTLNVSADERTLAVTDEGSCTFFHHESGAWQVLFEDSTFMDAGGGYPEAFLGVAFHPNSTQAVITQVTRTRILDLASQKTQAEAAGGFFASAVYSPEGLSLLTTESPGYNIRHASTLKPMSSGLANQHRFVSGPLLVLPGDRYLASADCDGIWIWDLTTRTAVAHLASRKMLPNGLGLRSLALADNGRAIIADEGHSFLSWQLPSLQDWKPGQAPIEVPPSPAFGSLASEEEEGLLSGKVFSSKGGGVIISRQAGRPEFTLRTGLGARTSIAIPAPVGVFHLHQGAVSDDGKTFVYHHPMDHYFMKLDLDTRQSTPIRERVKGQKITDGKTRSYELWGLLPDGQRMIGYSGKNYCVVGLDGVSGLVETEDHPPTLSPYPGYPKANLPANSLAIQMFSNQTRNCYIGVWDASTGKLRGVQKMPFKDIHAWTMTENGETLICSHSSSAISLWDVSKMSTDISAYEAKPREEAELTPQPAAAPNLGKSPNIRTDRYDDSGPWLFSEGGIASKGAWLPEAGRFKIGGAEFTNKAWHLTNRQLLQRYLMAQSNFRESISTRAIQPFMYGKIGAGIISATEGRAENFWVSRQIGNPTAYSEPFMIFTDTVHNMSLETSHTQIEFEVRFPEGTGRLIDSSFKPVNVTADGIAEVDPEAVWVAPILKTGSADPVPLLVFRSMSSHQMPRILWVAKENRLVVRHEVDLPPSEPRHIVHAIRMVQRAAGVSPEHFSAPEWVDFSLAVPYSENLRGLNFSIRPIPNNSRLTMGLVTINESGGRSIPKDPLGFPWMQNRDGSFRGQMGASSVLQLRISEIPYPFSGSHLFTMIDGSSSERRQPVLMEYQGEDLERQLQVSRSLSQPYGKDPLSLVSDRFFNPTKESVTRQVTYVSTFSEPVKQIFSANGQPLASGTELELDKSQGALVFEMPGEERPATLVAFHEPGAPLKPRLSMPTPKMLRIDYEITIPPLQWVSLWHGATQRPLASFASVVEAFTGCVPLKRLRANQPLVNGSNVK